MRAVRIAVPVTSVWRGLDSAGEADAAITRAQPDAGAWAAALDTAARHTLLGRLDTQALLGEPALVVAEQDGWAQVRLPWQPSNSALDGYPGWVPAAHLIDEPRGMPAPAGSPASPAIPALPADGAVVTARLAAAVADDGERLELSFGTVLPVAEPGRPLLRHPDGRVLTVDAADIAFADARRDLDLIDRARLFAGQPYLWAGLAGHGVDCSGFVHLVHRAAGRVIPRDAHDQALVGTPVPPDEVRAGDVVFFENASGVHHTGFALDAARLLHSPRTGKLVGEGSITNDYPGELHAFRRFL